MGETFFHTVPWRQELEPSSPVPRIMRKPFVEPTVTKRQAAIRSTQRAEIDRISAQAPIPSYSDDAVGAPVGDKITSWGNDPELAMDQALAAWQQDVDYLKRRLVGVAKARDDLKAQLKERDHGPCTMPMGMREPHH